MKKINLITTHHVRRAQAVEFPEPGWLTITMSGGRRVTARATRAAIALAKEKAAQHTDARVQALIQKLNELYARTMEEDVGDEV